MFSPLQQEIDVSRILLLSGDASTVSIHSTYYAHVGISKPVSRVTSHAQKPVKIASPGNGSITTLNTSNRVKFYTGCNPRNGTIENAVRRPFISVPCAKLSRVSINEPCGTLSCAAFFIPSSPVEPDAASDRSFAHMARCSYWGTSKGSLVAPGDESVPCFQRGMMRFHVCRVSFSLFFFEGSAVFERSNLRCCGIEFRVGSMHKLISSRGGNVFEGWI